MKPIERILAAIDFSNYGEETVKAASYLCKMLKAKLTVLHIVNQAPFDGHFFGPASMDLMNEVEEKARVELSKAVKNWIGEEQEAQIEVDMGVPYVDILRYAKSIKCQFLMMGTHSREGLDRILLGSVAETLMQKSEVPVWTVKGKFAPPRKILLPIDFSNASRAGFTLGLFLAKLLGASVHLLHVYEFPYVPPYSMIDVTEYELKMKEMRREELAKWIEEAKMSKLEVSGSLKEGRVTEEVQKYTEQEKIDLMVISTHGESGLFYKHVGSVAHHLIRHSPCSVVSIRPENFKLKEI